MCAFVTYSSQKSWPWDHENRVACPALHMGSTVELALNMGFEGKHVPKGMRAMPASYLLCSGADTDTGPDKVIRLGELAMALSRGNIWESRPSTSPEQQVRALVSGTFLVKLP